MANSKINSAKWRLESGPRNKSLATQHLEYILYALLEPSCNVRFYNSTQNELMASVDGKIFNVTNILHADPDFTQILFSDAQLDAGLRLGFISSFYLLRWRKSFSHLHLAEKSALHTWTGSDHFFMNGLVRTSTISHRYAAKILFNIAFATHGLSKPLPSSSIDKLHDARTMTKSYRAEEIDEGVDGDFLEQRKRQVENNEPVTNRGFTAASTFGHNSIFGNIKTTICQFNAVNPIGKHISGLSYWGEGEVLFPPHTEFLYQRCGENIQNIPFSKGPSTSWLSPGKLYNFQDAFAKAGINFNTDTNTLATVLARLTSHGVTAEGIHHACSCNGPPHALFVAKFSRLVAGEMLLEKGMHRKIDQQIDCLSKEAQTFLRQNGYQNYIKLIELIRPAWKNPHFCRVIIKQAQPF